MKERPQAVSHVFMPGETISGAIKKHNFYNANPEEMIILLEQYRYCNVGLGNPRPGTVALIPILKRHFERAFQE